MDDVEVQRTIASGAVEYLKGQPFNNVLLAVLITLVALAAGYGLDSRETLGASADSLRRQRFGPTSIAAQVRSLEILGPGRNDLAFAHVVDLHILKDVDGLGTCRIDQLQRLRDIANRFQDHSGFLEQSSIGPA